MRLPLIARRAKAVLACLPVLLVVTPALASPFVPVVPPTCPATTNIAWNYTVGGGTWQFDLPSDPNCIGGAGNACPHYIDHLDHRRFFVSNPWVGYVGFRLAAFDIEPIYDNMEWGLENNPLKLKSGTAAAGTLLWVNTSASFGSTRALLNFKTDAIVSRTGFSFNQLRVCTYRSSADTAPPATLDLRRRYHGVLLGRSDTVYLQFAAHGAFHYPITLWRDVGSTGTDYDLYARCGALPTPNQYDWRGFSGDDQEFIDTGNCTGTMYVAVNAHVADGPGAFNLVRGIHRPAGHVPLRVGITPALSDPALVTSVGLNLREASRYYYAYTEGDQMVTQIDIYNSGSCGANSCGGASCDICYHSDVVGRANSGLCGGQINLYRSFDVRTAAHELAHLKFCIRDEYIDDPGPPPTTLEQCGHTVMANTMGDNANLCTGLDHNRDGESGAGQSPHESGWKQALWAGVATTYEDTTYDNYSYRVFDFNDQVGTVITH